MLDGLEPSSKKMRVESENFDAIIRRNVAEDCSMQVPDKITMPAGIDDVEQTSVQASQ